MTQITLRKRSVPSKDQYGNPQPSYTDYTLDTSRDLFLQPVKAEEIMLEQGYQVADYRKIYYPQTMSPLPVFQDLMVYQGITYMVLPPQEYEMAGTILYVKAILRRVIST